MNKNIEKKTFIYYLIMCLISVSLIRIHLAGNGNIGQVVFLTYYCLTALPLIIIFLKEKNLRNLCMLLCIAISVASTKRTGTIALILGILVMLVLDAHIQGSSERACKYNKFAPLGKSIEFGVGESICIVITRGKIYGLIEYFVIRNLLSKNARKQERNVV